MQQLGRTVHRAAERHADRLVAEAHTEQRGARRGARLDQGDRGAARSGVPGPGQSSTPSNCSAAIAIRRSGQAIVVVTPDVRVHTELAQVLDQVEHEAVVVVDDQDPHAIRLLVRYRTIAQ